MRFALLACTLRPFRVWATLISRDESLQEISWEQFFEKFDDQGLALLYQEKTARGAKSNFNKLVKRNRASAATAGR